MSMVNLDPVVVKAQIHLQQVLRGESLYDTSIIERANTKLSLDSSLLVGDDKVIVVLLPLLVTVLRTPFNNINYESVIELLQTILGQKSFQQVLAFISQSDLIEGLRSGVAPLQKACVSQIVKADPSDMLANTPLVDGLVEILASMSSDSSVVGATTRGLSSLAGKGELVRRRLFSGESLATLQNKMHDGDSILQGRLMTLITDLLPFDSPQVIPISLISFPPDSIDKDDDVLLVLNKIQFYRDLISNPHPSTLIAQIAPQLESIARLYNRRHEDPTVDSFLVNEIFAIFGAFSSVDPSGFRELDNLYNIASASELTDYNDDRKIMFLSLLSPKYLIENVPDVLRHMPVRARTVRAFRNLVMNEEAYKLCRPSAENMLELPYLELMALLTATTNTPWGTQDLLGSPRLMDSLLWNESIRERDTMSYRREVLDNLMKNPPEVLSVWYEPIRKKHRELVYGVAEVEPQAAVADKAG
jgi:hypothetical protein